MIREDGFAPHDTGRTPIAATLAVDLLHLRRAMSLAERGLGKVSPNPLVGAVVVSGGRVVGEGWHEGPGTPHAEVAALQAAGELARGGTLYVSLEPCAHQGRTPPCAVAIEEAGITRVVAATTDPNPKVHGQGFAYMRAVGIAVVQGMMEDEAKRLTAGFSKHVRTGLPLVTVKMGASLDGKVADGYGRSRWITGDEARRDAHRLRAASDAIVVGARTALLDLPALTVRLPDYGGRQPIRVVVDGRGRVPAEGALFDGSAQTIVATTEAAPTRARSRWEAAGAEVLSFPQGDDVRVPLRPLLAELGRRDLQNVMVEGGPTLAWDAIRAGVADRLVLYLAPKLMGGARARGLFQGDGVAALTDAVPVRITSVEMVGPDVKVAADVGPCA